MASKPLYYSTSTETTTITNETTTNTPPPPAAQNSGEKKYTSTEIRLIKKQKERILKKEKVDEVVGKLFNKMSLREVENTENVVEVSSPSEPIIAEKKKRKSKKADVKEANNTPVEEPIKKEAYTNPQIDSLVENILTMTIAGQASLAANAEEEDELISLLKTKRRQRFNTENSNVGINVGPTTYKTSMDKFSQQEVDFKQYTQTKESELSSTLEMSEDGEEEKAPIDPEDEDILSYLRELKERTLKQKEVEKKASDLEDETELDEEEKIVEKAWQDIASKPESVAKSVEAEFDEPVKKQETSKSNDNNKDDVVMQFLKDLLK